MKYFKIGDEVYVPKFKLIGTITDKFYEINNEELQLRIYPMNSLCNKAYGNSLNYDPMYVNYSAVRSLKPIDLYKHKSIEVSSDINELNIPNLLTKKDILEGTIIKVVDNYMLERVMSYSAGSFLYSKLVLSHLLDRKAPLTGKSMVLPNGELAAECKFDVGTYYVYTHSLQLIKKLNIIKRIWKRTWNTKFLKRIKGNPGLIFAFIWSITMLVVALAALIVKFHNH